VLNRYSSVITNDHDFPGAQVGRPHAEETYTDVLRQCSMLLAYLTSTP